MDTKIYPALIDEVTSLLPRLRGSLILLSQNEGSPMDLSGFLGETESLTGSARMLGHPEIERFCFEIATELREVTGSGTQTNGSTFRLLDLLAKLEAATLKTSLEEDDLALDIEGFVNESFGMLQASETVGPNAPPSFELDLDPFPPSPALFETPDTPEPTTIIPVDEPGGFEIDQELLDIFAEEADSLLKNMVSSLDQLSADPNNAEALWEIRRNAHTFKGSAGIVGLAQLSQLAHRMEDLLDRLVESKNGSGASVLSLLKESTETLKSLTGGNTSDSVALRISKLHAEFDRLANSLNEPESVEAVVEEVIPVTADEVEPIQKPKIPSPSAFTSETIARPSEPVDTPDQKIFAVVTPPKPPATRSVVRVSLERLDELVGLVRDMIVSRSAFEQKLRELDQQIDDLHNTTRRLHSASSKLEIDFEASMLRTSDSFTRGSATLASSFDDDRFDDLELDRYTEFHQTTRDLAETTSDTFSINTALDSLRGSFELLYDEQRRIVDGLQEKLMRIRMVEFGSLTNRLQRAVRVTCDEEGKKAQIALVNEKLEVDTQILDGLIEPLMHLLKNAVVHGIETPEIRRMLGKPEIGLIEVLVSNEETHIAVTVSDDGRGINPQALKEKALALNLIDQADADQQSEDDLMDLVFMPGLTTAKKLNLSAGRGVGMSIVRESIEAQRGSITIESIPQKGTSFKIRIPQKFAVTNVLLVRSGQQIYAVPHSLVRHVSEISIESGSEPAEFAFEDKTFQLTRLEDLVAEKGIAPASGNGYRNVVIVNAPKRKTAITVAEVVRSEEVVIKPLLHPLDNIKGVLGAAVLGNGDLVPILDLPALLKARSKPVRKVVEPSAPEIVSILIVDDSPSVRHMTSKVIERAGWIPKTAKDGIDALETLRTMPVSPALILTDIEMPRMDGYEFTASLRRSEDFQKIPVVMITSRTAEKHRDRATETGVTQYLTKPYDEAELLQTVRNLIS